MVKHTLFTVSLLTLSSTISTMPTIPTTLNADALKAQFQNMQAPQLDANTCANAAVVYVGFKAVEKLWGWATSTSTQTPAETLRQLAAATEVETLKERIDGKGGIASEIATLKKGLKDAQDGILRNAQGLTDVRNDIHGPEGVVNRLNGLRRTVVAVDNKPASTVGMSGNSAVTRSTGPNKITDKRNMFENLGAGNNNS